MFDNETDIDPRELPIYKKGEEIYQVVNQICQLIDDEDQHLLGITTNISDGF